MGSRTSPRIRLSWAATLALGVASATGGASAEPARDAVPASPQALVGRAFANLYGFSSVQQVRVLATQSGGREFVRTVQVVRRGVDEGLNRMLVRFTAPPELRGLGVLLLERDDYAYDAFLYQPALDRVRRITVAQRGDRFFGTDVYFEDLEARRAAQWKVKFLRDDSVSGRPARVIELVPDGVPSAYQRIVAWFDLELPVMLRAEFYRGGQRLKEFVIDPEQVVEVSGYFVPTYWTFRSDGEDSQTVLELSGVEVREKLPDRLFTRSALQFGDAQIDSRLP